MSKKVCEKCKLAIKDTDIICPHCGHPIVSETSPMKKRETIKSEEMTPARRRAKRIENIVYISIAVCLIVFVIAIYIILKSYFHADFSMLGKDIVRFFDDIIRFVKSAF